MANIVSTLKSAAVSSALINVDRLLIRRAPIAVDRLKPFAWPTAFLQLLRVLMLSILESVRETVFSENGSKHLQIDVSWLRDILHERLKSSRRFRVSTDETQNQQHCFGYQVPQRQVQNEETHLRLLSILTDEMILASAANVVVVGGGSEIDDDEIEVILRRLLQYDELDRIIMNEAPVERYL